MKKLKELGLMKGTFANPLTVRWMGSLGVAYGVFWYVWGVYGFWWGLVYGAFWPIWVGYRLASYFLGVPQ